MERATSWAPRSISHVATTNRWSKTPSSERRSMRRERTPGERFPGKVRSDHLDHTLIRRGPSPRASAAASATPGWVAPTFRCEPVCNRSRRVSKARGSAISRCAKGAVAYETCRYWSDAKERACREGGDIFSVSDCVVSSGCSPRSIRDSASRETSCGRVESHCCVEIRLCSTRRIR